MRFEGSRFWSSKAGRSARRAVAVLSTASMLGAMVAGFAPVASASALPGSVTFSFSPSPASVTVGNQVTVAVDATVSGSTYGMGSFQLDVQFNTADVTETACAGTIADTTVNCTFGSGDVRFTWANPSGLPNGGPVQIGTVTFQGVTAGSVSSLSFANVSANDAKGAPMGITPDGANIDVPSVLTSISGSPLSGPVSGGTHMTINGTGIGGATAVDFGSNAGMILSDNGSQIDVISPASTTGAGPVNLTVTTPAGTSNALTWTYVSGNTSSVGVWIAPQTQSIPPGGTATVDVMALGPSTNLGAWTLGVTYDNAIVTETGCSPLAGTRGGTCSVVNNLNGTSTVSFAGADSSGLAGTNDLQTITFTGGASGTSPLTIGVTTFNDQPGNPITPYSVTNGSITVNSAPTITNVSPTAGWPGGGASGDGTPVTITGTNFMSPTVTFGGNTATIVGAPTSTSITVDVPTDTVHAVGDVNGDGSVTSVDALCVLRSVVGLGVTDTACTATTTDVVNVVVTNNDGQSATVTNGYTYNRSDVSSTDGGTPNAVDALCVLRLVVNLPATAGCPA